MTLQISIIGYLIMVLFYVISAGLVALLWYPSRRWQGWKYVILPIAVVILALPWADEVYIAWRFHELCKDAGIHVYRKVEVEGFYNDVMPVEMNGYQFMEQKSNWENNIVRIEKNEDGKRIQTYVDKPSARYHYKYSANNEDMGLQLEKSEWVVIDSNNNEVLGRETIFKRYPGWVEGLWLRFLGIYPTICYGPLNEREKWKREGLIYDYVLTPKK